MGVDGRPTEQEALHLVAAEVCQRLELLDALDPLRHGDQAVADAEVVQHLLEVCPIRQAGQRIVHRQCLEDIRQALEQRGDREQPERAVRPAHHDILVPVLDVASEDRLGSQRQGQVGGQDQ